MLNLGVIGTNWISDSFCEAAIESKKYKVISVLSRTLENAVEFGKKYSLKYCETSMEDFLKIEEMNVVYIATPNSIHYEQALSVIKAGKHVIVEKPAFSNPYEMKEIIKTATENNVCFFEAARHIHEENFKLVKEQIKKLGAIKGANLSYMKYSSRYDYVLEGKEPNIFSPKYSGGSIMDLGVYLVYASLEWFGIPKEYHYFAKLISTKVDGIGIIIFRYDSFDIIMQTGKIAQSFLSNEIYGCQKTLILDSMNDITSIEVYDIKNNNSTQYAKKNQKNNMSDEVNAFADIINNMDNVEYIERYNQLLNLALNVNKIVTELRMEVGVRFDSDNKINL